MARRARLALLVSRAARVRLVSRVCKVLQVQRVRRRKVSRAALAQLGMVLPISLCHGPRAPVLRAKSGLTMAY